jgi:hypothetical protein
VRDSHGRRPVLELTDVEAARRPRDYAIALALVLGFWALYYLSLGVDKPNLSWFNFVLDADPARVIDDAVNGQNAIVFERHPLFGLIVGTLSRVFGAVVGRRAGVLGATSFLGAIGVGTSYLVFERVVTQRAAAIFFSLAFGLSAALWLVASLPETFAINAMIIVIVFLMQRPEFAQPVRQKLRFAGNVVFAALAIGVAVPNIVYVMLGQANSLRGAQPTIRRRAAVFAFFVAATWISFLIMGAIQSAIHPETQVQAMVAAPLTAAARDPFLRFDRSIVIGDMGRLVRAFVLDNVVAPPAIIEAARMPDGPLSIIQYGSARSGAYLIVVAALGCFALALAWRAPLRDIARDHSVQLAVAFIAYNIVFHFFYRANGQPFIFSAHTVFPLLFVVAKIYARSSFRFRAPALVLATSAVATNSVGFVRFVSVALALNCDQPVGNVCVAWRGHTDDPRFTNGVSTFLASADYPFELGMVDFSKRQLDASIAHFRQSIALDADFTSPRLFLGSALIQTNRLDDAIDLLESSLRRDPTNSELARLLDEAMRRKGLPPP